MGTRRRRNRAGVQDQAFLFDSAGADEFGAGPGWAYLSGTGFYNFASQFDLVFGYSLSSQPAGVRDQAYLFDSTGADTYSAGPGWAYMTGPGYYNYADQFDVVLGYALSANEPGLSDTAYLMDSAGADTFSAGPGWAYLTGPGFWNYAAQFDTVLAYATASEPAGVSDTAFLIGSAGADQFVSHPESASARGHRLREPCLHASTTCLRT